MTATISEAGCKQFSSFSALDAKEEEKKAGELKKLIIILKAF
jgi:hypothetical protein